MILIFPEHRCLTALPKPSIRAVSEVIVHAIKYETVRPCQQKKRGQSLIFAVLVDLGFVVLSVVVRHGYIFIPWLALIPF